MTALTFEDIPQAISDLIQKVDTLQSTVTALEKVCNRPVEEPMIGIEDACKIVHLAKSTVYALCQAHKIPFYQPGKMLQFKRSELMAWMEKSKQDTTSQTHDSITTQMQSTVRHKPNSNWGM